MNINIRSHFDAAEAINSRLSADKSKNRDVDGNIAANDNYIDKSVKIEKEKYQEKIQQASMMDVNEVKDFLFMLIGAEVKVKPENNDSGSLINRLA